MLSQHIALVPEGESVSISELARVSAALQMQVMRDLSPLWGVSASVAAFPLLEDVPAGYWPIMVMRGELGTEAGVRVDRDGQPFAQVELSPSWSLDASRACLEMLVNPFGHRTVSAPSLRSDQGVVQYLVEVCAPCGDAQRAYAIHDVIVSDFCTPAYFENGSLADGKRYAFNGSIERSFHVLPGGHVTWFDLVSASWWRRAHWGENPVDLKLGALDRAASSVRDLAPANLPVRLRSLTVDHLAFEARVGVDRQHAKLVAKLRAERLRDRSGRDSLNALLPGAQAKVTLPARSPSAAEPVESIEEVKAEDVVNDDEAMQATLPAIAAAASVPPPLPPKAAAPAAPAARTSSSSVAPITSMLDRERSTPRAQALPRGWIAGAALAAAAMVVWMVSARSSNDGASPPRAPHAALAPAAPRPLVTTQEAATAPAPTPTPTPTTQPSAPEPSVTTPVASARPTAPATPVHARTTRVAKKAPAAPPAAVVAAAAPPTPPAPAAPVEAPVVSIKPSAAPPLAAPAARAPVSIDDLIDTRR